LPPEGGAKGVVTMLVLSRKTGERIYLGENREIEITVVRIGSNNVRIGVDAPRDVPIVREELQATLSHSPSATPAA